MNELQIVLIATAATVCALVWNRRRSNRMAMHWRVSRALRIWIEHGEVYFNWNREGHGR